MKIGNIEVFRYIVQQYDTLEKIALKFNTSIEAISAVNRGVDLNTLHAGQNIFVGIGYSVFTDNRMPEGSREAKLQLMKDLRTLWEQHVMWTRLTIISMVENLPDVELVTARLLRNPEDFANLLARFYGRQKADVFKNLFTEHLTIAAQLVQAAKDGDNQKAEAAEKEWYRNAGQIAEFLAAINPYWSKREWVNMLDEHLRLTKTEAVDLITKQYAESINTYDEIERQALRMADMMFEGISKQFGLSR
ncbi:MAG: hypothetical protein K0R50_1124 [Eubacterium sp.]|jgi:hypothetical protein|nr:hypothetical protein [Eubacterium sp.]